MGIKRNVLVAVSGGPDSMYLLHLINKSFLLKPIAIHVNYKKRETSDRDQQIVEDYCKSKGIQYFVKSVDDNEWKDYAYLGSFQAKAREIRYRFFSEISKRVNAKVLFVGHNRDDFLETAIMQDDRSNDYLFYGIEAQSFHHGLKIERPLIKDSKNYILQKCNELKIPYGIDETNLKQLYERNKVRFELMSRSDKEKKTLYKHFNSLNKSKEMLRRKVNKQHSKWIDTQYSLSFFKSVDSEYKLHLVYKMLTNAKYELTINKNKVLGIIEFLENNPNSKKYRVMDNLFIEIRNDKIVFIKHEEV